MFDRRQSGNRLPRSPQSSPPGSRRRRLPTLEPLEDRHLLATLTLAGGVLSFSAGRRETDALSISVAHGQYTLHDSRAHIHLGQVAGWTQLDPHTVRGSADSFRSLRVSLGGGDGTVWIQCLNRPTTITSSRGTQTILVNSHADLTGDLAGIQAPLNVVAGGTATTNLLLSDLGNQSSQQSPKANANVVVGPNGITGFAGAADQTAIRYTTSGAGHFGFLALVGSGNPGLPEQFTLNDPNAPTLLWTGAGSDTINVQAINRPTMLDLGPGDNTVNVSSDAPRNLGTLDGIQAKLMIAGTAGMNTLNVSDFGQAALSSTVNLYADEITGFAGSNKDQVIAFAPGSFQTIRLDGSATVGETFDVWNSVPAVLDGNGGNNAFHFLGDGITILAVHGGLGFDTLDYPGYTGPVTITPLGADATGYFGVATGLVNGFSGLDALNGGSGVQGTIDGTTLTGTNVPGLWAVNDDTVVYSAGGRTQTYTGLTTLNAGPAGDTFHVLGTLAGEPITMNGGAGADTFTVTNLDRLQGNIQVHGGGQPGDSLQLDDTASTASVAWTVQGSSVHRQGAAAVSYAGLGSLAVSDGPGDGSVGNTVDIESTAAGTPVTFTVNPQGQDVVAVSQVAHNLDALQGGLTLAGTADATLLVNDQASTASHQYLVSDSGVSRDGVAPITLGGGLQAFGQLLVQGGAGAANSFDVTPGTATALTVAGGGGGATLTVHAPAGSSLQDDHSGTITDQNGRYQPVHYSAFATVSIV